MIISVVIGDFVIVKTIIFGIHMFKFYAWLDINTHF